MHLGYSNRCPLSPYTLAVLLILLLDIDVLLCMYTPKSSATSSVYDGGDYDVVSVVQPTKRTITATSSELEEFVNPSSNQLQGNYDEYPMIVPKRAALLLDRLMVALHHALEEERNGRRRIGDLYSPNGGEGVGKTPNFLLKGSINDFDQGGHYNMYDDAPSDFDFRDLNSANRATGETLMAKSFQRRAHGGREGVIGGGGGGRGGGSVVAEAGSGRNNGGRVYWRCYFNAVSCF